MFFIVGLKTRMSTVDTGRFACPYEGADRVYEHLKARRWFTVFFLPLIPLGTQGEHVVCTSCGTRYATDVVSSHPAAR